MDWRANCAAVIPCLNEAANIGRLVEGVRAHLATIMVIDDGSVDGTGREAEQAGARVRRHEITHGKGAALQTGWQWAREQGLSWALCLDGDGQHSPGDIPLFFECAQRTSAALVIGNRMGQPARMPLPRRVVNRWMSKQLSKRTGQELPDSQCGFRLMNLEVWAGLRIKTQHFEIESEILLAFLKAVRRVEFVPIRTIYKTERSKIHPLRDALRWWRWWCEARR